MEFQFAVHPLYVLSGFFVGVLVGMTGIGGGSLMTPILILLFGVHPATAVGTDLLFASLTKSVGVAVHGAARNIDWRLVLLLASGSVPATIASVLLLSTLNIHAAPGSSALTLVLAVVLMLTAMFLFGAERIRERYSAWIGKLGRRAGVLLTIALGAFMGFLVSFTSIGAGAIGVTMLVLLYPKMPFARIVGSDIAHAVPLTLVAGLGHWLLGSTDWPLLFTLLLGSLPGIVCGSYLAKHAPDALGRRILAVVLLAVGIKLFVS
jgi:uncharacterized membrane protein YfcA